MSRVERVWFHFMRKYCEWKKNFCLESKEWFYFMRKYCEWKKNFCLESREFGFILCVSTVSGKIIFVSSLKSLVLFYA